MDLVDLAIAVRVRGIRIKTASAGLNATLDTTKDLGATLDSKSDFGVTLGDENEELSS